MTIHPHHETAASMWGQGGRAYDDISFAVSDVLAHAAQRLNAIAGQQILDVATGTGWSARNAARRGAQLTAVDISAELLAAAELGRVCRRGGRLVIAAWVPGRAVAEFFGVIARHAGAPPPAASPLAWGDPAHAIRRWAASGAKGRRSGVVSRWEEDRCPSPHGPAPPTSTAGSSPRRRWSSPTGTAASTAATAAST